MSLFTGLARSLEAFAKRMSQFAHTLDCFISRFFGRIVDFLERTAIWLLDMAVRIRDYLVRVTNALRKITRAFVRIGWYYLPSIIAVIVFFINTDLWGCAVFAVVWFLFITGIGLTYRRDRNDS